MRMSSAIPHCGADAGADAMYAALADAGCLVVNDALPTSECRRVERELAGEMAAARVIEEDDPTQFYPGRTRRVTGLVERSETVRGIIVHDLSRELAERHLGANCERVQLHVTAAVSIGPGARAQVLHREEDLFPFFPLPRPNLILASMWAINDFSVANGATLLAPGSHRWPAGREAAADEVAAAEMPAGSVLYWLGGTLHGGGANTSDTWRYGVILTYSLGWLRQEENQYLDVPPDVLATLTPELRALTGHVMHGGLGFSTATVEA